MLVAHDAGVLWTKAMTASAEYIQPSVIGSAGDLLLAPEREYVSVTTNSERCFVGRAAVDQSQFKRWLKQDDKVSSPDYRTMMLAAIGYLTGAGQHSINYVGGLPLGHWKQRQTLEGLVNSLSGTQFSMTVGSIPYTTQIHVAESKVLPQPYGSLADAVYNTDGKMQATTVMGRMGGTDLARSRGMIVEIGSHTCHLLVVDHMKPLVSESVGLPYGITEAYKAIGNAIGNVPAWEVDRRILSGSLKPDATPFKELAKAIAAEAKGTNVDGDWHFVSGGGGARLFDYLDLPNKVLHSEPFKGNMRGFHKLGVMMWGKD